MNKFKSIRLSVLFLSVVVLLNNSSSAQEFSLTPLTPVTTSVSAATGEKPQSKVWSHDNKWWAVFPQGSNTILWRLDGTTWTAVLTLAAGNSHADCKVVGDVVHILLYKGTSSQLASLNYVPATSTYQFWTVRPSNVPITLDASVETATIDVDGNGRMWLASDGNTNMNIRWSESPYSTWSSPVTVASGIGSDDLGAVIALPGKVGVFWSNQTTKRFGFKTILNGADPALPANWSADEIPASQSANSFGAGMADDHLNMKVTSDGTLYCVAKTSYDNNAWPRIVLLVRRPSGSWDDLYDVGSSLGTRPIVIINEAMQKLKVIYTSQEGTGNIVYKESPLSTIAFGAESTLLTGSYNNPTSTKANYTEDIVILASGTSQVVGVRATDSDEPPLDPPAAENLVLHLKLDEASGTTLVDASTYNNNGTSFGSPARVAGVVGQALHLNGTSQYATVPDHASLDISAQITLSAWIRPAAKKTQYIIRKGNQGTTNGYELSLSSDGKVFFRINQAASANVYRVDSDIDYPIDGNTWMHVAGTYDGSTLKIYIDGILKSSVSPAATTIATNNVVVGIGAESNLTAASRFNGTIDDARIYNVALTAAQVQELTTLAPAAPLLLSPVDETIGVSLSPTFSWNAVPGSTYRLQVSAAADFSTIVYDEAAIAATSTTASGLMVNTIYYWRVNATSGSGTGVWSTTRSFTTIETVIDPLVAHFRLDESGGTAISDASTYENNGTTIGNPGRVTGINASALNLNGTSQYVTVPDDVSLDITNQITLSAWIKPTRTGTQYIIKKGVQSQTDGYELSLASSGKVFFRFNQHASGDLYRVNSTSNYPTDGETWMHIAATYDGMTLKIYIDGLLENSVSAASIPIAQNNLPLTLGAQSDGTVLFSGALDYVHVYNVALTQVAVQGLISAALPVTLSSFTAKASGKNVLVQWQTQSENNNKGFYVEHSQDGVNFNTLTFVASKANAGNSSTPLLYSHTDTNPYSGIGYYRLRQEDLDGKFVHGEVALVKMNTQSISLLKLYPNPAYEQVTLSITSPINSLITYTIHDIAGRTLSTGTKNIQNGMNRIVVNTAGLSAGQYVLRIITQKTGESVALTLIKK